MREARAPGVKELLNPNLVKLRGLTAAASWEMGSRGAEPRTESPLGFGHSSPALQRGLSGAWVDLAGIRQPAKPEPLLARSRLAGNADIDLVKSGKSGVCSSI